MRGEERRERQRGDLREARQRGEHPPRGRRRRDEQGGEQQHRHERVVGVALQRVQRERVGDPRVGERDRERRAAEAPAEQEQQPDREQVERDRGGVRGGEVVPQAAPPEDLLEGHVRLVVDGPVGVPVFVVGGVVPVQRLAVGDPLRADHPGVADVDHVGVGHVQADPKAEQEDHADRQPRSGDQQV